jgi:hypothetical protein
MRILSLIFTQPYPTNSIPAILSRSLPQFAQILEPRIRSAAYTGSGKHWSFEEYYGSSPPG